MKKIKKGPVPTSLIQWKAQNAVVPQNLFYGKGQFPHGDILEKLLNDQGHICAYTLKRIDINSAHIEHLKPQTLCKNEDEVREIAGHPRHREDVAWSNLVACFPEPNHSAPPTYGAVKKDSWWHPVDFISPLKNSCEGRFDFDPEGDIAPRMPADISAVTTIENIGLDDGKLCELRKTSYMSAGIHRRSLKPIMSLTQVEHLIAKWSARNAQTGAFPEFCVPLVQVAKQYAQSLRDRGINK